jgi:hypothetical protein
MYPQKAARAAENNAPQVAVSLPLTGVSVGSCGHFLVLFGTEAQGPSNFSAPETPARAF